MRIIIENIEPLDEYRNRLHHATGWLVDPVRSVLPRRNKHRNKEDIASHYDVGNDFFSIFLDETLTYSAGVFTEPGIPLAAASRAKYDRLIDKLGLQPDHRLLEIGTGWGGMALQASERVGCNITTTTISDEQLAEATRRVHEAGHADNVTLLDADWRDLEGTFDRIVSIEMIEGRRLATTTSSSRPSSAASPPTGWSAFRRSAFLIVATSGPRTPRTSSVASSSLVASFPPSRGQPFGVVGHPHERCSTSKPHRPLRRDTSAMA
ncbi:MAG: class I SAM-dependent methyltransferase [Acidimicrobiales bacterium]